MSINDKKYIIHFKYNNNFLMNLSEFNNFTYSYKNPTSYEVINENTSNLTTADCDITDLSFNTHGIKFIKNSTNFSPFISISSMTNYLNVNEDFTIYYRLKSDNNGLSDISIDLFSTNEPGLFDELLPHSRFYFENGILKLELKDTTSFSTEVDCRDYIQNKQYHIALTRSDGIIRIYVDGFKMYDSIEMNDGIYNGTLFYNTPNTTILPVYIGCVSSNNSVTLNDITICKDFCFFKNNEFVVPDDTFSLSSTSRALGLIETVEFDTEVNSSLIQRDKIIREIIIDLDDINEPTEREVNISLDLRTPIWRELAYIKTIRYDTRFNYVVDFEYSNPLGHREIVKNVTVRSSTIKDIKSLRRKMIAFVVNPLYSRKKGV